MYQDFDRLTKEELLNLFQAKACGNYTLGQAYTLWLRLRAYLTEKQRDLLYEGWDHYSMGRGRCEFDVACSKIRADWANVSLLPQSIEERWPILK